MTEREPCEVPSVGCQSRKCRCGVGVYYRAKAAALVELFKQVLPYLSIL